MGGSALCLGAPWAACIVSVGTLLVAGRASAQSEPVTSAESAQPLPETAPAPGRLGVRPARVTLRIKGRSFVVFDGARTRIAECDEACEFEAWPTDYYVQLQRDERHEETGRWVRFAQPGNYTLLLGDESKQNVGLAIGAIGGTVTVVGLLAIFAGMLSDDNCGSSDNAGGSNSCRTSPAEYGGIIAAGVGALGMGIGFGMYATNKTHIDYSAQPPISARVGPVPLPHGGLGLGATISF